MKFTSRKRLALSASILILGALSLLKLHIQKTEAPKPAEGSVESTVSGVQSPPKTHDGPILRNGEIWILASGAQDRQLTQTQGKVLTFDLSPSKKYLAYEQSVGMQDDWGIDDQLPQVPIPELRIITYPEGSPLVRFDRKFDGDSAFIHIEHWDEADRLRFNTSSGGAVDDQFRYDAPAGQLYIETWNPELRGYAYEPYPETRSRHPK